MDLPSSVTPPAPKPAAPPVPPVAPPVAPVTPAAPVPPTEPTPPAKTAKHKSFVDLVGEKVSQALKNEGKSPEQIAAEQKTNDDKAAADAVAAAAKAAETKPPVDDSDAALEAEIEAKTKDMTGAQKQAFAESRRAEREARRELKKVAPKLAEYDNLAQQVKDLQTQLDAAKTSTPTSSAEVEALKAELAAAKERDTEREQELTVAKVERTEAFQNTVTKPIEKVNDLVKRMAKKYPDLTETAMLTALNDTSDSQSDLIIAATEGMNIIDQRKIVDAAGEIVKANSAAETLRAQAKDVLSKLDSKSTAKLDEQAKATKQARTEAHAGNWKELQEALPDVLKTFEGDDEVTVAWNAASKDAEVFARDTDYVALPPKTQSQVLSRAAVFPLIVGAMQSVEKQLSDEKTAHEATRVELEKFLAKKPGAGAAPKDGEREVDPAGNETDWAKRVDAKLRAKGF